MSRDPPFLDGSLPARDSLQELQTVLERLESDYIHQVRSRDSVLSDEDRGTILHDLGENPCRTPLQGCHQLGFHSSDTRVSL